MNIDSTAELYLTEFFSFFYLFCLDLQKKGNKQFTVTRYLHNENVYNVFYGSDQNAGQPIEEFHMELIRLKLFWLDDPITSQRQRLTNFEMNQMLINALGYPNLLNHGQIRRCNEIHNTKNQSLEALLSILKIDADKTRAFLTQLYSFDHVILTKKIAQLRRENPNLSKYVGLSNSFDRVMLVAHVDNLESVQDQQIKTYRQTIKEALEIPFSTHPIDLNALQDLPNEFPSIREMYINELKMERNEHWKNEEHNRMVAMRANLGECFNESGGISTDAKVICQKLIDSTERRLKTILHTEQNMQDIQMKIRKIQTDIEKLVGTMNHLVKYSNNVAQRFLVERFTR